MPSELTPPERETRNIYDHRAERYVQTWLDIAGDGLGAPSPIKGRFAELLPSGRVLDIGAGGSGRAANWFLNNGYDYIGVDISQGMIAQARQNCPQARFKQISIYNLDFDDPFDGFWCSAVLLHIPKDRLGQALAAIHKNMKPEAYGFVSTKEGDGEVTEKDGRFHAYWRQEDFNRQLAETGYNVIEQGHSRIGDINWLDYIVQTR